MDFWVSRGERTNTRDTREVKQKQVCSLLDHFGTAGTDRRFVLDVVKLVLI